MFGRIKLLLAKVEDPNLQEQALALLWLSSYFQSDHQAALEFAEQTSRLGQALASPFIECSGRAWSSLGLHILGRHREADTQSESAIRLATTSKSSSWIFTSAEPGCGAMTASAVSRWILGFPDQALRRAQEACARAESLGNPYMQCATRGMALPNVLLFRREYEALLKACAAAIPLCHQFGYQEGLAWAMKFQAVALCMTGRMEEGLAQLRQMIAAQRSAGSVLALPVDLAHEAECCLAAGRHDEAAAALDTAMGIVKTRNERHWEPEVLRLLGEWHLAKGGRDAARKAKGWLIDGLELAHSRQARSLELRAAMSLARMPSASKSRKPALSLLKSVYDGFTEGFDTPDLKATAQQLA